MPPPEQKQDMNRRFAESYKILAQVPLAILEISQRYDGQCCAIWYGSTVRETSLVSAFW